MPDNDRTQIILDLIRKPAGWIIAITGFVTGVVGFVKLWQGNRNLVTAVLLTSGGGGLLLGCGALVYLTYRKYRLKKLASTQRDSKSSRTLYIRGINTRLESGDPLLILFGNGREADSSSEDWEYRIALTIMPSRDGTHTSVLLNVPISNLMRKRGPWRVFTFRQRAALFGHNAPEWQAVPDDSKQSFHANHSLLSDWPDYRIKSIDQCLIDLDAEYPKILPGSWIIMLTKLSHGGSFSIAFKVREVSVVTRADYSLVARISRLKVDTNEFLSKFDLRGTQVFVQSEQLELV